MERVEGIEPSYAAWEAAVLPLNYTRARFGSERCLYEDRLDGAIRRAVSYLPVDVSAPRDLSGRIAAR